MTRVARDGLLTSDLLRAFAGRLDELSGRSGAVASAVAAFATKIAPDEISVHQGAWQNRPDGRQPYSLQGKRPSTEGLFYWCSHGESNSGYKNENLGS